MTDVVAAGELSEHALLRRRLFSHGGLMLGLFLLAVIVALSLLAPLVAPHDPYAQDLTKRLVPPIWYPKGQWMHPLGTDNLGRDYISRVLWGGQISLLIGLSVMLISGFIGTTLGLVAGYFGDRTDLAITFLITTRLALPVVLVALAVVSLVSGSLLVVILVLGLLKWDRFAVVMRSATQQVRALDYVAAAQAAGASTARIVLREVLPNVAPQLIVVATLEAASAILLEAALSFLGLGVQPPAASWGNMLSGAQASLFNAPWLAVAPGAMIFLAVVAINLLGDALRDLLHPGE